MKVGSACAHKKLKPRFGVMSQSSGRSFGVYPQKSDARFAFDPSSLHRHRHLGQGSAELVQRRSALSCLADRGGWESWLSSMLLFARACLALDVGSRAALTRRVCHGGPRSLFASAEFHFCDTAGDGTISSFCFCRPARAASIHPTGVVRLPRPNTHTRNAKGEGFWHRMWADLVSALKVL